jgi:hypothetical protein
MDHGEEANSWSLLQRLSHRFGVDGFVIRDAKLDRLASVPGYEELEPFAEDAGDEVKSYRRGRGRRRPPESDRLKNDDVVLRAVDGLEERRPVEARERGS